MASWERPGKRGKKKDDAPVSKERAAEVVATRSNIKGEVVEEFIDLALGGKLVWNNGMMNMPISLFHNGVNHNRYGGLNQMLLMARGFTDPRCYGFAQLKAMGKYVKKGATSTRLVAYVDVDKGKEGVVEAKHECELGEVLAEKDKSRVFMIRVPVFNASQVSGLDPYMMPKREFSVSDSVNFMCNELTEKTGLAFETEDCVPHYSPFRDMIKMPAPERFLSLEDYEGTRLHELVHATGAIKRLGRFVDPQSRTPKDYAREELLAEMGAYFLCVTLGIAPSPSAIENHAAYVQHYAEQLRADHKLLFSVAKEAFKVMEYLEGFMPKAPVPESVTGGADKEKPGVSNIIVPRSTARRL